MKKYIHPYIVFVILFAFLISCSKENTTAKLSFLAFESESINTKASYSSNYKFDSASMVLENIDMTNIDFDSLSFETVEDSLEYWSALGKIHESFYGPFNIDIISGKSVPEIDIIEVAPGTYYSIRSRLGNGTGDSICFYLSGSVSIDLEEIVFECKSIWGVNFYVKNPYGFEIEENQLNEIWIKIDLNKIFEGINLELADIDSDSVIRINKDSNAALLDSIIHKLEIASQIGLSEISTKDPFVASWKDYRNYCY